MSEINLNKKVSNMLSKAKRGSISEYETWGIYRPRRMATVGFENGEYWTALDGADGLPTQYTIGNFEKVFSAVFGHLI